MINQHSERTNARINSIIKYLSNKNTATSLELAEAMEIPKSTINEYLRRMRDASLVTYVHEGVSGQRGCRYLYKLSAMGHRWTYKKTFLETEQELQPEPLDYAELMTLFFTLIKNRTGKCY